VPSNEVFDFTPDPRVLIALTATPMPPLDALCELIDNALDSFAAAEAKGNAIAHPLVLVTLPKPSELDTAGAAVIIRDNGLGLSSQEAENAIRAGYSGNNPHDSLGLFGMGFNISTGKLGRLTQLTTARASDDSALSVRIDLDELARTRKYEVPVSRAAKREGFVSGTEIRVSQWWPVGNPNSGFIRKLVQYGMPTIRRELGRRYATILRKRRVRLMVNDELCEPFEHCVWSPERYVEHRSMGKVPARIEFDRVVHSQRRCLECDTLVPPDAQDCPECGNSGFRTIDERIKGWIGVQRFDDPTNYGIDLSRNGRTIRPGEKQAFFEFVDDLKRVTKDYPADSIYGRIVGEVELNHVPVDFLKQDFQRNTPEWQRAMKFLRGESSLQPKQPGADKNDSHLYRLYQGYRRVRDFGRADMYMGFWDPESRRARRISRDVEAEYYERFLAREPGYFDDAEWWKLVEQATQKPSEELVECPFCGAQNLKGQDVCTVCEGVLLAKTCVNLDCCAEIPRSAEICPECGTAQQGAILEPWVCELCGHRNDPTLVVCAKCGEQRGTRNPFSRDFLIENSNKSDELSWAGCTVKLVDGSSSTPFDLDCYVLSEAARALWTGTDVPLRSFMSAKAIEVFLNLDHPLFRTYRVRPVELAVHEAARYIYETNKALAGDTSGRHSVASLYWQLLCAHWSDVLEETPDRLREEIEELFESLRERAPLLLGKRAADFYPELDEEAQRKLADNVISAGLTLQSLSEFVANGEYLSFVDSSSIVRLFGWAPDAFLDGSFWDVGYASAEAMGPAAAAQLQKQATALISACLQDVAQYGALKAPDQSVTARARASLDVLSRRRVN